MAHRRRRLFHLVVLVFASLAFGAAIAIAAVAGDTERIDGYWAGARVPIEGDAQIIEVIDYDFGVNERHGIFRDVPGLDPAAPVRVVSPTAPDQFTLEPNFDETRIRIGDPVERIRGRHRYTIDYPVGVRFVDGSGDQTRLSWNAIGPQWEVAIRNVEVHLVAPGLLSDVRCSTGRAGSWGGCEADQVEPGHLVVEVDKLSPGEGITVSAIAAEPNGALPSLPNAPTGDANDPGTGVLLPVIAAVVASLLAGLLASAAVRRAGREHVWIGGAADAAFGPAEGEQYAVRRVDHDELGDMATTEFAPPKGLSAWQGGVLLDERTTPDHKVAWLVEKAIAGELEFEGSGKKMVLRQSESRPPGVDVLSSMFGGRSSVQLGTYDPAFAKAWKRLDGDLDEWHRSSGLWDPVGDEQQKKVRIYGTLTLILGVAGTVGAAIMANRWGSGWIVGVVAGAVVAGASFAALLRSWELRIRTPEGSALWLRVESFRRFIHDSDARHADQAAEMGVLLEYTAWAVAVGEIGRWTKAMEGSTTAQQIDTRALYFTHVASDLGRATASAATAPSSSGGGGGGGSVGGGGGGGGGGSW